MKILQVINSLPTAGAEKLVIEISKKYIDLGHQVDILLLKKCNYSLEDEVFNNTQIKLHFLGERTSIYNPINILKIRKFLKASDYDVLHAHLFPTFYWVSLALGNYFKGLTIHTEHNTTNRRMANPILGWFDKFIYPNFDYHITISDAVRENLENHIKIDSSKIINIYNGVDLKAIEMAQPIDKSEFNLGPENKIILQVSAFRPQKDQPTLIKALAKLESEVHLFLAGNGEMKDSCIALAQQLKIEERVHFLGIRKDIPQLLKTADIVVLSSFYEGLSLSSVEGLASEKPFIASDVPGLTEVVKDAGLLFPQGDSDTLAKRINSLFLDKDLYHKTALDCVQRSKKYDINMMVSKHLELYTKEKQAR